VARFRLDDVPFTLPRRSAMFGRLTREQHLRRLVEDVLVGCGLSEAYTPSLVADDADPDALRVPVPLSAEYAVLRTSLIPSLVQAVQRNLDAGNEDVALFEIARVYLPSGDKLPTEVWRAAGILPDGYLRAKGVVEALHEAFRLKPRFERGEEPFLHPGQTARLEAGVVGALRPGVLEGTWGTFELDLATLVAGGSDSVEYTDVITYPAVRQDLAFIVDEGVPAGDLVDAAREAAGSELGSPQVFDVYRGDPIPEGKKSIALAVSFQSPERTLSDEDAAELRGRIVRALADRFGAELRA
jgi:phenylalanyl-tRNA synthetase beta chain